MNKFSLVFNRDGDDLLEIGCFSSGTLAELAVQIENGFRPVGAMPADKLRVIADITVPDFRPVELGYLPAGSGASSSTQWAPNGHPTGDQHWAKCVL